MDKKCGMGVPSNKRMEILLEGIYHYNQEIGNRRILNVGCYLDTYGTDFIDNYPARRGVKKVDLDHDRYPYQNNTFDVVYAKNVFEHLRNPAYFLDECKRILKSRGTLLIITDNAGFYGVYGKIHTAPLEVAQGVEDRHYMLFTTYHLKNWLHTAGFRTIKTKYASVNIVLRILGKFNPRISTYVIALAQK